MSEFDNGVQVQVSEAATLADRENYLTGLIQVMLRLIQVTLKEGIESGDGLSVEEIRDLAESLGLDVSSSATVYIEVSVTVEVEVEYYTGDLDPDVIEVDVNYYDGEISVDSSEDGVEINGFTVSHSVNGAWVG